LRPVFLWIDMISRRVLRIKVLQVLYAQYNAGTSSLSTVEKELFHSINKGYELYHMLLLLLIELAKQAEKKIEIGKEKHRPTKDELNPNTRFIENKVIALLRKNAHLAKYVAGNKISWVNHQDLLKTLFQSIITSQHFAEYMSKSENSFQDDIQILCKIIELDIAPNDQLIQLLEELSIYWTDDFEFMLSMVIKTIEGFSEDENADNPLLPLFKNEDDRTFSKDLLRCAMLKQEEFKELIMSHSQNWEFDRIAVMDIIIMQMALAEVTEFPSIPIKVTLNEYIELAKFFSTNNSSVFINGILDNIFQKLKKENKIVKTGRGLIDN
jgi:transcription antitermination protein NusB